MLAQLSLVVRAYLYVGSLLRACRAVVKRHTCTCDDWGYGQHHNLTEATRAVRLSKLLLLSCCVPGLQPYQPLGGLSVGVCPGGRGGGNRKAGARGCW
jgi:hypothetical protein